MSRANVLAFVQALAIAFAAILGILTLIATIENNDEIAKTKQAQEARAVRAAYADQAMGIVRLAAR